MRSKKCVHRTATIIIDDVDKKTMKEIESEFKEELMEILEATDEKDKWSQIRKRVNKMNKEELDRDVIRIRRKYQGE